MKDKHNVKSVTTITEHDELLKLSQFTMEHVGDAIYWVGPDASIAYANQSAVRMLGYDKDELLKMKVLDINAHFDEFTWSQHWEKLADRKHYRFESEQISKDGRKITVEISANIIEFEGIVLSCSVVRDITDRRRAELDRKHLLSNQEMLDATLRGQESEARRIARDLHDGLGQYLSAAKIQIEVLKNSYKDRSKASRAIEAIEVAISKSVIESERLSRNLLPVVLEDFGCVKALEHLCQSIDREYDIDVAFYCNECDVRFDPRLELTIYRLAQESVNNALRHASPTSIDVQLIIHPGHVVLTIEDDGRGFNLNELGKNGTRVGLGLRNLCHRTEEIGGRIDIDTSEGNGTVVMVRIPLEGRRD